MLESVQNASHVNATLRLHIHDCRFLGRMSPVRVGECSTTQKPNVEFAMDHFLSGGNVSGWHITQNFHFIP